MFRFKFIPSEYLRQVFQVSKQKPDCLASRECDHLEFKGSYDPRRFSKYARTCAAFANRDGGMIAFGIGDSPRRIIGLKDDRFDSMDPKDLTEFLNAYFSPEIIWEPHIHEFADKYFGLIYVHKSQDKPVLCTKNYGSDLREGEIYYRYRARTQAIKYPELKAILESRRRMEQDMWMKHVSQIARIGVREAGIFDINSGQVTGHSGTFIIDESLLGRLRYIKEGEFCEKDGAPAVRIVGDAQVVARSLLPSSREIIRTKGIRTPDIVYAFLDRTKLDNPLDYFRQIAFESAGYLPFFFLLRQSKISLKKGKEIIENTKFTSNGKTILLKRLESDRDLSYSINEEYESGVKRMVLRKAILSQKLDKDIDEKSVCNLLYAVRTLSKKEIRQGYLFKGTSKYSLRGLSL